MRTKVIVFCLLAAVAASVAWLLFCGESTGSPIARISQEGVLLEEIDLNQVEESCTLTFEDERGTNTVLVEPGRIRILEADCPDQVCVNQGFISDGTVPIVCLPHRLLVEIVGAEGDLDGGAG